MDEPEFFDPEELQIVVGRFQSLGGPVTIVQCHDCKIVTIKVGNEPYTLWHKNCPSARKANDGYTWEQKKELVRLRHRPQTSTKGR